MRTALLIAALLITAACSTPNSKQATQDFTVLAKEIIQDTKDNKAAKLVREKNTKLLLLARPILAKYQAKNPSCKEFLDIVLSKEKEMKGLTLKQIETQYHDGEALPGTQDECYNAKELIVHPATVHILTIKKYTKEGREQIVDELEELVAHIDIL